MQGRITKLRGAWISKELIHASQIVQVYEMIDMHTPTWLPISQNLLNVSESPGLPSILKSDAYFFKFRVSTL